MKLQDDPATSPYLAPPKLLSGGGGLVGTAADYLRFATMLINGGELDGARILAPKTVDLMASNHLPGGQDLTELSRSLFSESTNAGVGFGLGFAVVFDAAADPDPLQRRRVLLGRRGLDRLLGRPAGAGDRGVHDPAPALVHLPDPPRTQDSGVRGADGDVRLRTPQASGAASAASARAAGAIDDSIFDFRHGPHR